MGSNDPYRGHIAFGPVPSRRLGRSLGINNIPPKNCTYSCVYCQVGRTTSNRTGRQSFHRPGDILRSVEVKLEEASDKGLHVDHLTFVPDGEPTLDVNLGAHIALLKRTGTDIAVITNSSLMHAGDVREELGTADWVSVKVDAADEGVWRGVNRPNRSLRLDDVLGGIIAFSRDFTGTLVTETMLVKGVNDGEEDLERVADAISEIGPGMSYISIPTRPPTEGWVEPPDEGALNAAYQIFKERSLNVELLTGYEGNDFSSTGDVESDILSITSVHPMRRDALAELLGRADRDWGLVEGLIERGELIELGYGANRFYLRRLFNRKRHSGRPRE